jgi:hypothetical protein
LGYWIGEHPWVKANFSLVALAMIIIPGLPALWIFSKEVFKKIQARRSASLACMVIAHFYVGRAMQINRPRIYPFFNSELQAR